MVCRAWLRKRKAFCKPFLEHGSLPKAVHMFAGSQLPPEWSNRKPTLRCCLISSLPFTHCLLGTSPCCCSLATPRATALHLQGKLPRGAQTGTVQADRAFKVQLVMLCFHEIQLIIVPWLTMGLQFNQFRLS